MGSEGMIWTAAQPFSLNIAVFRVYIIFVVDGLLGI